MAGAEISQNPPSLAAPESGAYISEGLYLSGNEDISPEGLIVLVYFVFSNSLSKIMLELDFLVTFR